jgi:hypothetical protein
MSQEEKEMLKEKELLVEEWMNEILNGKCKKCPAPHSQTTDKPNTFTFPVFEYKSIVYPQINISEMVKE